MLEEAATQLQRQTDRRLRRRQHRTPLIAALCILRMWRLQRQMVSLMQLFSLEAQIACLMCAVDEALAVSRLRSRQCTL